MNVYLTNINDFANAELVKEHFPLRFEKAERFRFNADKLRSYCAGYLIWQVLGLDENDILVDSNGKPYSKKADFDFNVSHSGDYVVLAYGKGKIGIDIEKANDNNLTVSKRVFTQNEQKYLNEIDGEKLKRFNTLWSLKESVMKLNGKGIALSPSSFDVMQLVSGGSIAVEGDIVYSMTTFVDDYALSVSSTQPMDSLKINIL